MKILILVLSYDDNGGTYSKFYESQKNTWNTVEIGGVSTLFYFGNAKETLIENDNLIFFDVNDHLKTFSENYQIATVFDNDQRAVPGFVYIKDLESILNFNKFVNNFNNTNDMELFSLYNNSNQLKMNLPILPTNYDLDLKSQTGLTTKNPQQFFKNYDKFNSVFDAASIGQFIGGIDGRNINSNKDTSGFINESCLFSMKNFQVDFLKDDYKRRVPYLNYKDRICKINNLHIHSKNLKKYLS